MLGYIPACFVRQRRKTVRPFVRFYVQPSMLCRVCGVQTEVAELRCKIILSLRGNAQTDLEGQPEQG